MDWGHSKVVCPLSGPDDCSSWTVCFGWSGLCYSWLENSTICFGRRPGLCTFVHMVCVVFTITLFFLTSQYINTLPGYTWPNPVSSLASWLHTSNVASRNEIMHNLSSCFDIWIVINLFRGIPESARWLLGQGRTEEANKFIHRVAAINKKKIPDNLLEEVSQIWFNYIG